MRVRLRKRPRVFTAGGVKISDCGSVFLKPDELVTFVTPSGRRYDIAAKRWGFYATPSVNARLKKEGFRTALVRNGNGRYFVMLVEKNRIDLFKSYLKRQGSAVREWLDEL